MVTDTGCDSRSVGPFTRDGPTVPAAEGDGEGACCCRRTAMPMAAAPPTISDTPLKLASLIRPRPGGAGAGATWLSAGHDMTTRNPAMRGCLPIYAVPFPKLPPGVSLA